MIPTDQYQWFDRWAEKHEFFIGTVLELSGLSHLDSDPMEVLHGSWVLRHEAAKDFSARGEWVPEPLSREAGLHPQRDAAYRMVITGSYTVGDRSSLRTMDTARTMLQERLS